MSIYKGPTEGGSGGKRGHSNMEHWGYTDEVKEAARKRRRLNDKKIVDQELRDYLSLDPKSEQSPGTQN